MNNLKRAVGYVRVSTAEQAEYGYSVEAQKLQIENYCTQHGYELVGIYADNGISGKNMSSRPELIRMIKDSKNSIFETVIVWRLNRISRKQIDTLNILSELFEYNIGFKSCTENFDIDSPTGKLLFQIMGGINEFERNSIVENVKMGMNQRAREGEWNGGIILGYDTVKVQGRNMKDIKSHLAINPNEAPIVKEIFELYASGKGLKAIVNHINHKGYRTKKGNPFNVNGVRDILLNPTYVGKIRFNVRQNWSEKRRKGLNPNPIIVKGNHDAIISEELWDKVSQIHKSKSGRQKKVYYGSFPLTGLLKCPMCGASMVAHHTSRIRKDGSKYTARYYVCSDFKNKGSSVCHSNSVPADKVEFDVLKRIQDVIMNEKVLKKIVASLNEKERNHFVPLTNELKSIEKLLEENEKKSKKYLKMFEDDLFDPVIMRDRVKELQKEREGFCKRKLEISGLLSNFEYTEISYDSVKDALKDFHKLISCSNESKVKLLMQLVIEKITVTSKREIDSIKLTFDEKIATFLNKTIEPSSDDDGSSVNNSKMLQSFMIRFPPHNPKPPINLLQQHHLHHLMRKSHL